jgi:hypothetical protein
VSVLLHAVIEHDLRRRPRTSRGSAARRSRSAPVVLVVVIVSAGGTALVRALI